ncbi:hypothetical protein [uncultured Litoreibacter sp.]|uniref:hypothetical protein n=1 Tax=uncultured Litoreibacter sp. TaxID=1392394 RepID=UPI0026223EBA|nr:hypothetical protein [uncultured Litoreibacter sp.]
MVRQTLKIFRSRYVVILLLIVGGVAFVTLPIFDAGERVREPLEGTALALKKVSAQCEIEVEDFARTTGTDFQLGAASSFCLCVSAELLLGFGQDQDAINAADALISNPDILRAIIRLEDSGNSCRAN